MRLRESELEKLGAEFFRGDRVYLFGTLGSGKTTATRYFISQTLNVKSDVTSPTFAYWRDCGEGIYHFDLYRLTDRLHFVRIGGEDVFDDPDAVCFVEWPEKIEADLPPTVEIRFTPVPGEPDLRDIQFRRLSFPPGKRPARR